MTTKLHINIAQGIIDVEGDPKFVKDVYDDFKDQLIEAAGSSRFSAVPPHKLGGENEQPAKTKKTRRGPAKKRSSVQQDGNSISSDSPRLDKHLDTAALQDFYDRYAVKSHPDKILTFLTFLTDVAGVDNPNSDQVYTCYKAVNEKLPAAFAQAFRDTSGKGYIELKSSTEMPVTIGGQNHLNFKLKKGAE